MMDEMISLTGGMKIISQIALSPLGSLPVCVRVLVGAGLPEVCASDSEQQ